MQSTDTQPQTAIERCVQDFIRTVPALMHRFGMEMRFRQQAAMPVGQFRLLFHLHHDKISIGELAHHARVKPPVISRQIDRLVEAGMATRTRDLHDRRVVKVGLTKQGLSWLEEGQEAAQTWLRQRLSQLEPREIEVVLEGMQLLRKAFQVDEEDHGE
jgi:DNA-binding MarR family transcriptional regulator